MILKKLSYSLILTLLSASICLSGFAQQKLSSDELFQIARKTAFDQKNYPAAINLCKEALMSSPGYTDVQVFLGRLYFWSDHTDSARILLDGALQNNPAHEDAAIAAASISFFSDQFDESLHYCAIGLQHHPHSKDLLLQKAKTLVAMHNYGPASQITDSLLKIDPSFTGARTLNERIKDYSASNKIGVSYDYTHFAKQFDDPWHLISLDYSRQTKMGSFTGRVNYGNRFGNGGFQFEADAYPRIAKNFYGYVNIGYSPDMPIFPKLRSGFSLYANLPEGFEADAGFRYLNFDNDTWIYTGSVGKYYKSFWFNLRAYITPDNNRISQSYSLSGRYYTGGANDYISASIGSGISPDDRSQAIQLNSNYKLQARRASAGYHFSHKKLNIFSFSCSYANIEYLPKTKDNQLTASIGYQRRF